MALVEPGPTGVKTQAEAVASVVEPDESAAARQPLGLVFWRAATRTAILVVPAVFRDLRPRRDPEALGIRTREVAQNEGLGSNAWFGARAGP